MSVLWADILLVSASFIFFTSFCWFGTSITFVIAKGNNSSNNKVKYILLAFCLRAVFTQTASFEKPSLGIFSSYLNVVHTVRLYFYAINLFVCLYLLHTRFNDDASVCMYVCVVEGVVVSSLQWHLEWRQVHRDRVRRQESDALRSHLLAELAAVMRGSWSHLVTFISVLL